MDEERVGERGEGMQLGVGGRGGGGDNGLHVCVVQHGESIAEQHAGHVAPLSFPGPLQRAAGEGAAHAELLRERGCA